MFCLVQAYFLLPQFHTFCPVALSFLSLILLVVLPFSFPLLTLSVHLGPVNAMFSSTPLFQSVLVYADLVLVCFRSDCCPHPTISAAYSLLPYLPQLGLNDGIA